MPRLPDWIIFALVLGMVAYALRDAGPPNPSEALRRTPQALAPDLSDEHAFSDPLSGRAFVDVGQPQNSIGTAYALGREGLWMTARHVVDGCDRIAIRARHGRLVPIKDSIVAPRSDLALLRTENSKNGLELNLETPLQPGQTGYHIGYPKGRPGEASARLIGRLRLASRGRYRFEEEVLAWAETSRSKGLRGSLGGISGGPVLNAQGEVIGTVIAESPRRGRLFSASPASMAQFLQSLGISPTGARAGQLNDDSYSHTARQLRRKQSVVQVVCRVYRQT